MGNAIKFSCPNCTAEIIVRYLKIGDAAKCKSCGSEVSVPADAVKTEIPSVALMPSMEKPLTNQVALMPDQIKDAENWQKRFNWGAFFLTPLWLIFHGKVLMGILLIIFNIALRFFLELGGIGTNIFGIFLSLLIGAYFGARGNEIAMKDRGNQLLEDVKKRERIWSIWGILLGCLFFGLIIILLLSSSFQSIR